MTNQVKVPQTAFDYCYKQIVGVLDRYTTQKGIGGWTDKVSAFKKDSLEPLNAKSEKDLSDLQSLKTLTKNFAGGLKTWSNWLSLGLVGGSSLQSQLTTLLTSLETVNDPLHIDDMTENMSPDPNADTQDEDEDEDFEDSDTQEQKEENEEDRDEGRQHNTVPPPATIDTTSAESSFAPIQEKTCWTRIVEKVTHSSCCRSRVNKTN